MFQSDSEGQDDPKMASTESVASRALIIPLNNINSVSARLSLATPPRMRHTYYNSQEKLALTVASRGRPLSD